MYKKFLIGLIAVMLLSLSSFQLSANIGARMKSARAKATTAIQMEKLKKIFDECKRESVYDAQNEDTKKIIRNACTDLAVLQVRGNTDLGLGSDF